METFEPPPPPKWDSDSILRILERKFVVMTPRPHSYSGTHICRIYFLHRPMTRIACVSTQGGRILSAKKTSWLLRAPVAVTVTGYRLYPMCRAQLPGDALAMDVDTGGRESVATLGDKYLAFANTGACLGGRILF